MGQAKARGTFEQRRMEAIERNECEEQQREIDKMARWSKMSKAEQNKHLRMAQFMVMAGSLKEPT